MANIQYKIHDDNPKSEIDIESLINKYNKMDNTNINYDNDMSMVYMIDYETNYTVKMLSQIMDYYELEKRKLKKKDMIERIILFELDLENFEIVERRKELWKYISILKDDPFLSKYIIF
tara:strand:- start:499 stop:855 length:357 start_codon:yes stop_codon:yes gene_type:complete